MGLDYGPSNKPLGHEPHILDPKPGQYRVSSEVNAAGVVTHWVWQYRKRDYNSDWVLATREPFETKQDAFDWIGEQ